MEMYIWQGMTIHAGTSIHISDIYVTDVHFYVCVQ